MGTGAREKPIGLGTKNIARFRTVSGPRTALLPRRPKHKSKSRSLSSVDIEVSSHFVNTNEIPSPHHSRCNLGSEIYCPPNRTAEGKRMHPLRTRRTQMSVSRHQSRHRQSAYPLSTQRFRHTGVRFPIPPDAISECSRAYLILSTPRNRYRVWLQGITQVRAIRFNSFHVDESAKRS